MDNATVFYGLTFSFDNEKLPDETSYEWVQFLVTMHLILPVVKENYRLSNRKDIYVMHHICMSLLKGSALCSFKKEIQSFEKVRESNFFYVLQNMSCNYLSSDLCLLLKNYLCDMDFSSLVRESNSKIVFNMLKFYNLNFFYFSATLSSINVSARKVSEIVKKKQSSYINFASISAKDLILVNL